ncbi:MAG: 3-isopropylmalate dehydratase large subunit [Deltaproteobacteria bacterium]|nr:3-isopropylmalate dehydratase large subunit [Deltaproteobacteria bacterium]MBW2129155.1 3-isopropylmalate dehydratase large subunit [Deltaproteobacteria bacterium]
MTLAEKILAAHAGQAKVRPGEFIRAQVDLVMAEDLTAGIAIDQFKNMGGKRVFDPSKVVMVADHFVPTKDVAAAEAIKKIRTFAREQGIHYYEIGPESGIEHVILPENGLVLPGDLVVGADSHTCTYGALGAFATGIGSTDAAAVMATGEIWLKVPPTISFVYKGKLPFWVGGKDLILFTIGKIGVDGALYAVMEFRGPVVKTLSMDDRFTMANMAVEAGAKTGLFAVDEQTVEYAEARAQRPFEVYPADYEQDYKSHYEFDVSDLEPQVALPHSPANVVPISQVDNIAIDQVVIGSCTNGRLGDLRLAAKVLQGRTVMQGVRCIIIPGSQKVFLEALQEGLIEIFLRAGAAVNTPTCGPCVGGHCGILAAGERCVSTTNRNFIGRMGSPHAEIFLTNPAVAAASAVAGRLVHPGEVTSTC